MSECFNYSASKLFNFSISDFKLLSSQFSDMMKSRHAMAE